MELELKAHELWWILVTLTALPGCSRAAAKYRRRLVSLGFEECGSRYVYGKFCGRKESREEYTAQVLDTVPEGVKATVLPFTDEQYGMIRHAG